jgi:hypothetical protein
MSDNRARPSSARPEAAEPSRAELVEVGIRKIMTSIVIAGGLIALAVYSKDDPPQYQVAAADGRMYRINTQSGTVIGCEGRTCAIVLQRGQDLDDKLPERALPAPAQARPALPAPEASKAGNEAAEEENKAGR